MVKLRRLSITRYSDVAPCDLRFDDGVNVVLGINGSGKTTLLRLVADLLSWRFEDTVTDAELAWSVDTGSRRIDLSFAASTDGAKLAVVATGDGRSTRVDLVRDRHGWHQPDVLNAVAASARSFFFWFLDEEVAGSAFGGLIGESTRLDEGLDYFRALTADRAYSTTAHAQSPTGPVEARLGVLGLASAGAVGARLPRKDNEIRVGDGDLPWLRRARTLFGYDRAEAVWRVVDRRTEGGKEHFDFAPLDVLFERGDRAVAASRLSYGQMRMLAYQYYLDVHRDVVVADELVNGLHHAWVRACLEDIGDRQAFLTSQNPILFNELDLASAEQIGRCIVACRLEEREGRRVMVWTNLTDDDANEVFLAKDVGIESTSDILISRGLW